MIGFSVLTVLFSFLGARVCATPPQLAPLKVPENLEQGQRLAILCAALQGTQPISFSWRKDNVPLEIKDDIRVSHEDFQETLQIQKLNADHSGNYSCSARNIHGSDQMSVSLVIKSLPRWVSEKKDEVIDAVAGTTISVNCAALGFPAAIVRIYKKDKLLDMTGAYTLNNGILEIQHVSPADAGSIKCEASNTLGSVEKTVKISLTGNFELELLFAVVICCGTYRLVRKL